MMDAEDMRLLESLLGNGMDDLQHDSAALPFDHNPQASQTIYAEVATQPPPLSPSSSSLSASSSSVVGDFELKILSSRIANTDQLVRTIHQQTQEINSLKAQLVSINESVMNVAGTARADAQRTLQLQHERDQLQRQTVQLNAALQAAQDMALNASSIHTQDMAAVELRCQQADSELIEVCRQFLVQGNLLSDNRLSNGALNRYYMKAGEMLKRRGQPVDGLLRTTASARKRRPSRGCAMATQTDFPERVVVERPAPPKQRSCATMTDAGTTMAVASTMTDLRADEITIRRAQVAVCDRATQALPTTTTRGTSTVLTKMVTVGTGTVQRKSATVGTSTECTGWPERPDVEEILSRVVVQLPTPLSPIADCSAAAATGRDNVGCQTSDDLLEAGPPPSAAVETQTVGTMTTLANVRKRIEYAKRGARTQTASTSPTLGQQMMLLQQQQQLMQQQQQHMFDIKKEEQLSSPFGSMQDLSAIGAAAAVPPTSQPDGRAINPQLSGLWRVLGQMLFSIIGSGRIFDDEPSTMEMINRNLTQIRCAVEMATKQNEEVEAVVDKPGYMPDSLEEPDAAEEVPNESDQSTGEMETQTDDATGHTPEPNEIVIDKPAIEIDNSTINTANAAAASIPTAAGPKLRVISEHITKQLAPETSHALAPSPTAAETSHELDASLAADAADDSPLPSALPATPATGTADDDALFKRPTSAAVRRNSIRQKAIARKNLARRTKLPFISPPSYSIDRTFKRSRRRSVCVVPPGADFMSEPRRSPKRVPTSQTAGAGSPKRKRQRVDEPPAGIDVNHISQYFHMPPMLIEPIEDLEEDCELDMEIEEENNVEEEYTAKETETAATTCASKMANISSALFHDLFGDGDSDDDDVVENAVGSESSIDLEIAEYAASLIVDTSTASGTVEPTTAPLTEELSAPVEEPSAPLEEPIDFSYSPSSPPPSPEADEFDEPSEPIFIPLNTIKPTVTPVIQQILRTAYRPDVLKLLRKPNTISESTDPQRFDHLHRILVRYLRHAEFTAARVDACAQRLIRASNGSRRWLAMTLQEIVEDIADEPLDTTATPPSSALSESHQQLIVMVARLDEQLPGFRRYCQFLVEQTLFTFSAQKPMAACIVSLVRYFVALDDLQHRATKSRLRLFLFKCLYYYQHTATPMVYTVLCSTPQCLPAVPDARDAAVAVALERAVADGAADPIDADAIVPACLSGDEATAWTVRAFAALDPLVQALHVVLANTNYNDPKTGCLTLRGDLFRKGELLQMLRKQYRYPAIRHTFEQLLANMMQRIRDGRLHNVANALILMGKRNGCSWTQRHMLDGLQQLLRQLLAAKEENTGDRESGADAADDERIECLLHTLGSLVKPFPVTEDVTDLQTLFGAAMVDSHSDRVQEAAVSALMQTARFGAINVYRMVANWKPTLEHEISRKLWLQLQTFVHRKPRKFWA